MITQKIKKLKKYLLFISIVFFVLTLTHLTYVYIYSDSKNTPVKGGIISEGIIGKFPSLNPITSAYNSDEKYITQLLYRSILKYDINQKKIVGDIAQCDISSIEKIECIINENAKWSNGEKITTEDIISTYNIIKETESNKVLSTLLIDTKIEVIDSNVIVFRSSKKDINVLNIFLQPILNKSIIDSLTLENINGNFPITGGIYSGKFIIDKVTEDESLGITKLTLAKNEFYPESNISRLIINIFPDINSFKKNYAAVNIFNDSDNLIGNSIYKFQEQKYTLNSFLGIFLNQNKIQNKDLRNHILNKLDSEKLIKVLGEQNFEKVLNPFFNEKSITKEVGNKNFDSIMSSLGYRKKSYFVQEITPEKEKKSESEEKPKEVEKTPQEITIPEDLTLDRYIKDSKIIFSPEYVDNYNFISKDNVVLKGNVSENVSAVYVNDYKLAGFKAGNKEFSYRLKESVGNLKAGKNIYKIFFEINGQKVFQEELQFTYYHDKNILKEEEKNLAISLYKAEKQAELNKQEESKKQEENKVAEKNEEENKKNKELSEKINSLDENLYYDKNFNPFSLNLYFIEDGKKETSETIKFIENSLQELGITVKTTGFQIKELAKVISKKDDYDMILTGVHLGYLNQNVFPYLHSSQAKSGYNFTNIRKPALDLLVEEIKENIYTEEKTKEIQDKILEILQEEQVLKTLYTPKINLLIDRKTKIEKNYNSLPYKSERNGILENAYVNEAKVIDYKSKSISGFFKFILKKLYE